MDASCLRLALTATTRDSSVVVSSFPRRKLQTAHTSVSDDPASRAPSLDSDTSFFSSGRTRLKYVSATEAPEEAGLVSDKVFRSGSDALTNSTFFRLMPAPKGRLC
ncbi:hypothetical protein ACRALDRAFT_1059199 [Sodiomyces alcalophilus JCM 7366]|uniref:uncharacterized protein n=1 Tax=Sodiomyces alcalophilus JCM 7366 TaxID=591952 RepID=UPI0039B5883C